MSVGSAAVRTVIGVWRSATAMTWASLAVRVAVYAGLLPLALRLLSPAEASIWLLLAAIASFQTIFDAGLSQTFVRVIAYVRGGASVATLIEARGPPSQTAGAATMDGRSLKRVLATMATVFGVLAVLALILLAVAGGLVLQRPAAQLTDGNDAWLSAVMVLAGTVYALFGNGYSSYLTAFNRIPALRRWELLFSALGFVSAMTALASGGGLVGLVAAQQLWVVLAVARNRSLCRRDRIFRDGFRFAPDREVWRMLWPSAWRTAIGALGGFGVIQLSGVAVAQHAASAQSAAYLLALRLIQTVSLFSQAPFYSRLPAMALLYSQGQLPEVLRSAASGMRRSHWTFVAGFLGVTALATPALALVGSQTAFVGLPLWTLMGAAYYVERLGAMHIQLYTTTGTVIWHLANGACGLGMLLFWQLSSNTLGLAAYPLAMLLSYALIYAPITVSNSARAFRFSPLVFERNIALPPALVAAGGVTLLVWANAQFGNDFLFRP